VGGDHGHAARAGEVRQPTHEPLAVAFEMTMHVDRQAITEDTLEAVETLRRPGIHERTVLAAGEAVQPGGVLLELIPRGQGVALRPPGGGSGEQTAEIAGAGE